MDYQLRKYEALDIEADVAYLPEWHRREATIPLLVDHTLCGWMGHEHFETVASVSELHEYE